ncbi:MAG: hypothetical protein RL346_1305 [Verrucomicrobiota bacterium]
MLAVLPTAGASRYICSANMACAGDASSCLSGDDSCCGESGGENPDCLIAKHVLPDAEHPNSLKFSHIQTDIPVMTRAVIDEIPRIRLLQVNDDSRIAPDRLRRLYIDQQRLLI